MDDADAAPLPARITESAPVTEIATLTFEVMVAENVAVKAWDDQETLVVM